MLAIPLSVEVEDQLAQLAEMTGKTKTLLAKQAINDYLEREMWQITETEHALIEADENDFVPASELKLKFKNWGISAN